jgi:hypothetical protein
MTLFEIDQRILSCLDMETGEIVDPEQLEALQMERTQKIENIALWIKNLESDKIALKAQEDAFAERKKAVERRIDSLKNYLVRALDGEKFTTTMCAVSFRKSERVTIDDEGAFVEWARENKDDLLSYKMPTVDKTAVKAALKSGMQFDGVRLESCLNPQIK